MQKILVTGCARSGTKYMSEVFQAMDLDVKHEAIGEHGISSYYFALGDVDYPFWMPQWDELGENPIIFHQVRCPLNTIGSCYIKNFEGLFRSTLWFFAHQYMDDTKSPLWNCMSYWYHWNLLTEELPVTYRYQIEEIDNDLTTICAYAGLNCDFSVLDFVPRDINTTGYSMNLTWDDLYREDYDLAELIEELAIRYGYRPDADGFE